MASTSSSEALFINSVLFSRDMLTPGKYGVQPEHLIRFPDEWRFIQTFYARHRKLPSKQTFMAQFPNFPLRRIDQADTAHAAEQVITAFTQRQLMEAMKTTAAYITDGDLEGALAYAHNNILKIGAYAGLTLEGDIFTDNNDIMQALQDTIDRTKDGSSVGIPLGFPTFDRHTGGAKIGELITVAARLGVGKSWILSQWASNAVRHHHNVLYNSLEMTRPQMFARIIPLMHDIGGVLFSNTDLMMGNYNVADFKLFMDNLERSLDGRLNIVDRGKGACTPTAIAAQIERLNPDIVFVDYISLMARTKDWQEVGQISGELKQVALQYKLPVVMAAQLNRNAVALSSKGEPPGPEDIAQSDMIGMDSDTIITAATKSARVMRMRCVKNRHGRGDFMWNAEFNPTEGIFREVSYNRMLTLVEEDKEHKAQEAEDQQGETDQD